MEDKNKLSIASGEEGIVISRGADARVNTTDDELLNALVEMPDINNFLAKLKEKKLAKKKEQYDKLKPQGFEHAPDSAKIKREKLENVDDVEELQWIHDNVSYNPDHTINIIKLSKTFCEDISGQDKFFAFAQIQELENTNAGGYKLMTDYDDGDSQKKSSDWYKLINIFSKGNGDTIEGVEFLRDMAGCNNRYWTANKYSNEKGEELAGFIRNGLMSEKYFVRTGTSTYGNYRVCGRKDMTI